MQIPVCKSTVQNINSLKLTLHLRSDSVASRSNDLWLYQEIKCSILWGAYSQKEYDSGVGHGKRQSQNSTAHDGVAEVKDGHAK